MDLVWMVSSYDDEAHESRHRVAKTVDERDQFVAVSQRLGLRTVLQVWDPARHAGEVTWSLAA